MWVEHEDANEDEVLSQEQYLEDMVDELDLQDQP